MNHMELNDIKRVMVVGAGTMGHSIAQVYAQSGFRVDLVDLKQEILEKARERIQSNLMLLADYHRVTKEEIYSNLVFLLSTKRQTGKNSNASKIGVTEMSLYKL